MIRLFSSDLDGTLLGNPEAATRFRDLWQNLDPIRRPVLVYNSGRLIEDILELLKSGLLPEPDFLIGGIGTEMYSMHDGRRVEEFTKKFHQGWDLEKIEDLLSHIPGIEKQPPEFLHPYKSSWYLPRAESEHIADIEKRLEEAGIEGRVIYSSHRDLDVLPKNASKGSAVEWLCSLLQISLKEVVVAGDTANDTSAFLLPKVNGIIVENAQPELYEVTVRLPIFHSKKVFADGVIEGLIHFDVFQDTEALKMRVPESRSRDIDPSLKIKFESKALKALKPKEKAFICTGFSKAIEVIRKNITPLGFSACSLADNETTGTDANYKSVWARDGAMTLIATLELNDASIREAQRQTLCTLLDHLSPNGQIPTNIRIDDGKPDYSGIGGICSIDSGLWTIIAFYHYINHTEDYEFLKKYSSKLQEAMDWLSAHDSNNDGLLEVPEAGDWTDLFGRSYNVLYDEILWYRANVCYGRLLEFQRNFTQAADYLRWAQYIRGEILAAFWPSTRHASEAATTATPIHFSDQQFSLGDSQFLLAQISPFSFSWRCDVFGNILAFLTNILDADRAKIAFRFMWGVGVNMPFPVRNLYPVVHAGDPDWRSYYAVNLLNLPNHYHNGGIWPFIGGMWVQFIYRLGLDDIAARELYRLAELNYQGRQQEWEFNEWFHGETGRPMGKSFQAWSAASYIAAFTELNLHEAVELNVSE